MNQSSVQALKWSLEQVMKDEAWFVTLTNAEPDYLGRRTCDQWRKCADRLKKDGVKAEWVRVLECHASGALHCHVVINSALGADHVVACWKWGYTACKRIDNVESMKGYLIKDLVKGRQKKFKLRVRVWGASRGLVRCCDVHTSSEVTEVFARLATAEVRADRILRYRLLQRIKIARELGACIRLLGSIGELDAIVNSRSSPVYVRVTIVIL